MSLNVNPDVSKNCRICYLRLEWRTAKVKTAIRLSCILICHWFQFVKFKVWIQFLWCINWLHSIFVAIDSISKNLKVVSSYMIIWDFCSLRNVFIMSLETPECRILPKQVANIPQSLPLSLLKCNVKSAIPAITITASAKNTSRILSNGSYSLQCRWVASLARKRFDAYEQMFCTNFQDQLIKVFCAMKIKLVYKNGK